MAKQRAARREQREREAATLAQQRARQVQRAGRRRDLADRLRRLTPTRRRRPDGALARRRRAQNRAVAAGFVLVQVLGWLVEQSVPASLGLLVLTAFALPVVLTLLFDRRS